MSNKFGENLKAVALAASIASSPEALADKNISVRNQLEHVKTDVQYTIEKGNTSEKASLATLRKEISGNPFAISQKQGEQYADSGEITSDAKSTPEIKVNFIGEEAKKGLKIPSNFSKAKSGNAEFAVWKDAKGNLNATVTKPDNNGGTDSFAFNATIDGTTYYFYTTPNMELVAKKLTKEEAELMLSCDATERDGILKGRDETKCKINYGINKDKQEIAADKQEIAADKQEIAADKQEIAATLKEREATIKEREAANQRIEILRQSILKKVSK